MRVLSFAVTSALLAGAAGCEPQVVSSNPGPVRERAASPVPKASPTSDAEPAASATASPSPEAPHDGYMTNPVPLHLDLDEEEGEKSR
tara:strand:+ start:938 stop:1201 length:264 start_codon:yes stop_codon:yes gene_type:complete